MCKFGKIITVDLSSEKIDVSEMSEAAVRKNLGGLGCNVDTLYHHADLHIDPFDPDNLLVISRGLLTGTVAPSSARVHINTLSPQSGLIGSSNVGGFLGFRMYSLDIFSIIIKGKPTKWAYSGPVITRTTSLTTWKESMVTIWPVSLKRRADAIAARSAARLK
ncbi:MAG: aldehyde ferredoxin oxidoreductase N-terminal domain-containing protein [Thermodesulfobacteriota bacterium]